MPDDWDEDVDGDWEPKTINNPEYKGPWRQKKIVNPAFKGHWQPTQLANDDHVVEIGEYPEHAYVGFELWTVNHGSIFDNVRCSFSDRTFALEKCHCVSPRLCSA